MRIFADKKIKKQLLVFALLFAIIELIGVLIGTINSIMLGPTLSIETAEKTITAVGFASQIFLFLNTVTSALIYISNTFYSQHYGRGDIQQVEKDHCFCQKLAVFISLLFFALSMIIPNQLIGIFAQNDQEVIQLGGDYLRIFGVSFLFVPPVKMNYSLVKNTRLEVQAVVCSVVTLLLVVIFNSIFLYALNLGPLGAALSIVLARFIELVITSVVIKSKCVAHPTLKGFFYPDFTRFKTSSKILSTVFAGKIFWGLGVLASVIIVGLFNDRDLNAANQLMLLAQNLVNTFCIGIATASGIIIGRELGAGRLIKAKETTHDILKFCILFGLILIGVFLLFLPLNYLINKNLDELTLYYMIALFLIQSIMFIPRVYNYVIVNGILFTGGDTTYPSLIDPLAYLLIVIPFSIISLKLNWSPLIPLILIQLEEGLKTGFFYYRYRQYKWAKNLTNKGSLVFK